MMERQREAYREEAAELLADLEESLLLLEETPQDRETVDRAFRDLHTIKGSGAMFGFDLIGAFAHEFEDAFDAVRQGRLEISTELISVGLKARDHLAALLDHDEAVPPETAATGEQILNLLRAVAGPQGNDPEQAPLSSSSFPQPVENMAAATFRIRFRPPENCFLTGTNPLLLLNELRELGTASVVSRTESLPGLTELDAESCYFGWDIILTTRAGEDAIRDVFIFIEADSELAIETICEEELSEACVRHLGELLAARQDVSRDDLAAAAQDREPDGGLVPDATVEPGPGAELVRAEQKNPREAPDSRSGGAAPSVRVAAPRLDALVNVVGEIVTLQERISELANSGGNPALSAVSEDMDRLTEQLREIAMSIRMLPVGTAFQRLKRLTRDLSSELGKKVDLRTSGEDTELDKTVIERLADPLVHLIRNALDHGIESPLDRRAAGKPETGVIRLDASHEGGFVVINVADDGAGLARERILARARRNGLLEPGAEPDDSDVWALILEPGFSTAEAVTGVSGRGVGMDVVRRTIEDLRGALEIHSDPGQGTVFRIRLPLTLAIIEGLLVQTGEQIFVLPMADVVECIEHTAKLNGLQRNGRLAVIRGELVGCIPLREYFGVEGGAPEFEQIVVIQTSRGKLGLVVDRVLGNHQTVIKEIGKLYRSFPHVSGATVLGDGSVALILDAARLAV